jgi:hypothetical protein
VKLGLDAEAKFGETGAGVASDFLPKILLSQVHMGYFA